MKILVAVIMLFCFGIAAGAQNDSTFRLPHTRKYKQITLHIIRYLGIPHRLSHFGDGRLKFTFYQPSAYRQGVAPYGMFFRGRYLYRPPDTLNVVYPAPVIYINRKVFTDLKQNKDTSEQFVKALSCVLHEITHYYQFINYNYITYRSSEDYHSYFCQPSEVDAYAVEAYFYLSKRKPLELQRVLRRYAGDNFRIKRELIQLHSLYIRRPVLSDLRELVCPQ